MPEEKSLQVQGLAASTEGSLSRQFDSRINSVLLPAAVTLFLISNTSEQGALRRMLPIVGFVLAALGALLMVLHGAD
jgi:hypothetical protein